MGSQRSAISLLKSAWWLPVSATLVGLVVGFVLALVQPPKYTASTQLFVSTTNSATTTEVFQGSQFSEQRVTSYAELLGGRDLAGRVVEALGLNMNPTELSQEISANAVTGTVLINVSVTDESAARAQRIASALGSQFISYASELEATDGAGKSPVKVTVTQRPSLPQSPSSPSLPAYGVLGAMLGFALGVGIVLVRGRLDRSIKSSADAAEIAESPVIGTILRDELLEKRHVFDPASASRVAEDFRKLRTNLQFLNVDEPPKVIMVASAVPSEGKTTLVVNLAIALAEAGRRVTVVEADLRRPKVTNYLGMVGGVGLTNVLAGTAEVSDVTQTFRERMFVIAAGPTPPNPGELLASSHMATLLAELREKNEVVLIDSPPILPVADSAGLAVHTDGVLLSVRYGSTRRDQVRQAAISLERVSSKVLGVVLNIVSPKAEVASAYGYGYSYEYEPPRHLATS